MKRTYKYTLLLLLITGLSACKKDNYSEPQSVLSGRLMYNDTPIYVEQDQVSFELWQAGFGKYAPIRSAFNQDGGYSASLFNGTYKLVIPSGQGPFEWKTDASGRPDSLTVELKGSQQLDLQVTPYYLIQNATVQAGQGKINTSFDLEKVISGENEKSIERVSLYINKTQFVSGNSVANIAQTTLSGSELDGLMGLQLSVDIPELIPSQDYVFARIGVKIQDVEDLLFSPLFKISL